MELCLIFTIFDVCMHGFLLYLRIFFSELAVVVFLQYAASNKVHGVLVFGKMQEGRFFMRHGEASLGESI